MVLLSLWVGKYKGAVAQKACKPSACTLTVLRDSAALAAANESQVQGFVTYIGRLSPGPCLPGLCSALQWGSWGWESREGSGFPVGVKKVRTRYGLKGQS